MDNYPGSPNPQARILVVDDEPATRTFITRALNLMNYQADSVASGSQALARLATTPYDLVLLDLRMPGIDGVEVMKHVRQSHPDTLVIVLTAHGSMESAIVAVRTGAADYLLKPCSIRDIEAAIAGALRRRHERMCREQIVNTSAEAMDGFELEEQLAMLAASRPARFLQHGPVSLDLEKRLVIVAGDGAAGDFSVELTPNELALLACLMQHPETVFSCRELARRGMGYDVSEREAESIVRPHISRLRKKIGAAPASFEIVRTVRGKGYAFSL